MSHSPAPGPRHPHRWSLVRRFSILALLVMTMGIGAFPATATPPLIPNADNGAGSSTASGPRLTVDRLFNEVFTGQDGEICAELMTAGATHLTPVGQFTGPEGFNAYVATIWNAFPDAVFAIDDVSENGTSVTVRWSMAGTHLGPLEDMDASGRPVSLQGLALFHFEGDRIASTWIQYDRLGLIEQVTSGPRAVCPQCRETP